MIEFWHQATPFGNICLECAGHAGFASKGRDIICAAASILMESTAEALKKSGAPGMQVTVNEEAPKYIIKCRMTQETAEIVRTAICGFEMMAREAPEYVSCHRMTAEENPRKKNM